MDIRRQAAKELASGESTNFVLRCLHCWKGKEQIYSANITRDPTKHQISSYDEIIGLLHVPTSTLVPWDEEFEQMYLEEFTLWVEEKYKPYAGS